MTAEQRSDERTERWLANAIRDARSRPHRNLRRRRVHLLRIERHHTREQWTVGGKTSAG